MADASAGGTGPERLEDRIAGLLEAGQTFIAHDLAAAGLRDNPGNDRLKILFALALLRSGAVAEAVETLRPILARYDTAPLERAATAFRDAVGRLSGISASDPAAHDLIETLVRSLDAVRAAGQRSRQFEPGLLLELGELHLEAWRRTGTPRLLEFALILLRQAFDHAGTARAGARAALALWLLGRQGEARALAAVVTATPAGPAATAPAPTPEAVFREDAARALARLIGGAGAQAVAEMARACEVLDRRSAVVVPMLRACRDLRAAGLEVPRELDHILRPPGIVVFTGHWMDVPGAGHRRLPPGIEGPLREEIARRLAGMDVQIGYSGAACGSDLLFIEALLERGGDANIILPFAQEDFVPACVGYAGRRWEQRFTTALKLAESVVFATREPYLGHDQLFRFQNQMLHGLATLRSAALETAPHLLAVWDMQAGSLAGDAAGLIDEWTDISRIGIIDPDEVAPGPSVAAVSVPMVATPSPPLEPAREIRAMLFADLVGFSKLAEGRIPAFMAFLEKISADLKAGAPAPVMINTWGDAIFAVMNTAYDLAQFAFQLKSAVSRFRSTPEDGTGVFLDIRISLHAGPVFAGRDPFNDRPNFFGAHINRAARLEPVTVPGHIYATQHFVALLTAEESQRRSVAEGLGESWSALAICEYVGVMSLAKNFGREPVYHVHEA